MSAKDAHYGGNLVDGAHMVHLFGDVATELLIMHDGDEGLFAGYDNVEFLAPVYAGDYIEARGEIVKVGNSSRKWCLRHGRWFQHVPTSQLRQPMSSQNRFWYAALPAPAWFAKLTKESNTINRQTKAWRNL